MRPPGPSSASGPVRFLHLGIVSLSRMSEREKPAHASFSRNSAESRRRGGGGAPGRVGMEQYLGYGGLCPENPPGSPPAGGDPGPRPSQPTRPREGAPPPPPPAGR